MSDRVNTAPTTIEDDEAAIRDALLRIHAGGTYRAEGYDTFRAYYRARHANPPAIFTKEAIAPADVPMPTAGQERALARLPDAVSRRDVWLMLVATYGADVAPEKMSPAIEGCLLLRENSAPIQIVIQRLTAMVNVLVDIRDGNAYATFAALSEENADLDPSLMRFLARDELAES